MKLKKSLQLDSSDRSGYLHCPYCKSDDVYYADSTYAEIYSIRLGMDGEYAITLCLCGNCKKLFVDDIPHDTSNVVIVE